MSSENQSSSMKMPSQIQSSIHKNQKKNDLSKKIRKIIQQKNKKKKNDYLLKKKLEKKKRRDDQKKTCDCADKTDRYPGNILSYNICDTSDSDNLDYLEEGHMYMDTDDQHVVHCANAAVKEFNRLHPEKCVYLFKIVDAGHPTCMEIRYDLKIKVQETKKSDESEHFRAFTLWAIVCPNTFMVHLLNELPELL